MSNKIIAFYYIGFFFIISIFGYNYKRIFIKEQQSYIEELQKETEPFSIDLKLFGELVDSISNVRNLSREDYRILKVRTDTYKKDLLHKSIELKVLNTKIKEIDIKILNLLWVISISYLVNVITFLYLIYRKNNRNENNQII